MSETTFTNELIQRHTDLWGRMLEHPFLIQARDGALEEEIFTTWLRQDYLFVEAAIPFIGALISRAPTPELRRTLAPIPALLEQELDLFRERAQVLGVSMDTIKPAYINHAYVQFLRATGTSEPFEAAFTVYWAAEKAYHESWKVVSPGVGEDHPWRPFVENWAGAEFGALVEMLTGIVDDLAEQSGPDARAHMEHLFELTTLHEIAFWELALRGPTWPGI